MTYRRPVIINEAEKEIVAAKTHDGFIHHLEQNDPVLAGFCTFDESDTEVLKKEFENGEFVALEGVWNKYADQLGLQKIE